MHDVCTYVCMYEVVSQQYVCMHGHHIYQSIDQPGKVANPVRGQLYTHASVPLHLYTSDTSNRVPWVLMHRLNSARAYVHTRKYKGTPEHV